MTATTQISADWIQKSDARTQVVGRDLGIDTMRGIAILMVIGIHSMPQPLDPLWGKLVDAALRPCVPIFLFASGYLTALSGRVVLGRRIKTALIPYAIAFVAAYIYMAWHNPAMDHRITTTIARFVLAYVFVYYYVFVYIGCTVCLWLVFRISDASSHQAQQRLAILLSLSLLAGLVVGSYLDPLLLKRGFSESFVQEVRLRNIPFWFSFVALGALVGTSSAGLALRDSRLLVAVATLLAYMIYAAVRVAGIGDAADYDSTAFFAYAALVAILLLGLHPRSHLLAVIGSGSYFIYLWHIFVIMILRDHFSLSASGTVIEFAVTYATTAVVSIFALLIIRRVASARISRWLGA